MRNYVLRTKNGTAEELEQLCDDIKRVRGKNARLSYENETVSADLNETKRKRLREISEVYFDPSDPAHQEEREAELAKVNEPWEWDDKPSEELPF